MFINLFYQYLSVFYNIYHDFCTELHFKSLQKIEQWKQLLKAMIQYKTREAYSADIYVNVISEI